MDLKTKEQQETTLSVVTDFVHLQTFRQRDKEGLWFLYVTNFGPRQLFFASIIPG